MSTMSTNDEIKEMKLLALRREDPKHPGAYQAYQWLIANGGNIGRWTCNFGVHCLADFDYVQEYITNMFLEYPESEILEYRIHKL